MPYCHSEPRSGEESVSFAAFVIGMAVRIGATSERRTDSSVAFGSLRMTIARLLVVILRERHALQSAGELARIVVGGVLVADEIGLEDLRARGATAIGRHELD